MSESLSVRQPETELYQTKDIASLIVNSFRFSRGSGSLQDDFLQFIAGRHHDRFDIAIFDEARPAVESAVSSIYTNPRLHPPRRPRAPNEGPENTPAVVARQTETYLTRLRNIVRISKATSARPVPTLCPNLVNTELSWVGRAPHWVKPPKRLPLKPFTSNLVSYGFLERGIEREEFDEAFRFAGAAILRTPEKEWAGGYIKQSQKVSQLIQAHVSIHMADVEELAPMLAGTPFENALDLD